MILNQSYKYAHMTATTTVGNIGSILHNIIVNNIGTTATMVVTDGANTIANFATLTAGTYTYDITVGTSITITLTGSPDITVAYQ